MGRQIVSLIVFFIIIVILVGAGVFLYRFLVSFNSSTVDVLTINSKGQYTSYNIRVDNNKPFRVKNESSSKQVLKKKSDNSTFVEVDGNATSRELTLPDDSKTQLYLASNTNQVATILYGNAKSDTATNPPPPPPPASNTTNNSSSTTNSNSTSNNSNSTNNSTSNTSTNTSGSVAGTSTQSKPLPNTGPENYLIAPLVALFGLGLFQLSKKILLKK